MQTILDSNVVLDLIQPQQAWVHWSSRQVSACANAGPLVVNTIVYAEISSQYHLHEEVQRSLVNFGIILEEIPWMAAFQAGKAHRAYRRAGGRQERLLPDFLIGAHADVNGYRLLTRDQARYRSYFPALDIIAPDTHP